MDTNDTVNMLVRTFKRHSECVLVMAFASSVAVSSDGLSVLQKAWQQTY